MLYSSCSVAHWTAARTSAEAGYRYVTLDAQMTVKDACEALGTEYFKGRCYLPLVKVRGGHMLRPWSRW